jgi:hypothetical protein
MHGTDRINVTVLRGGCADEETCPAVTRIDHDPAGRYLIGERVTDPEILMAHASRMAPNEVLVRFPQELIPEVDG